MKTDKECFKDIIEVLKDVIPYSAEHNCLAYKFFAQWMIEMKKCLRRKVQHPMWNSQNSVRRQWVKIYGGETATDVARQAQKIMERLCELDEGFNSISL